MQKSYTKEINGILFEKMIRSGLRNLRAREQEINSLNVFPVADGDTGTNMCLTLENGIRSAESHKDLCAYVKSLSRGMLLSARGNSGVILSQIFKGIYLELSRSNSATPYEMRNAFIRGYKVAYESVIKPVEGTILTVAREGIDHTTRSLKKIPHMEALFEAYLSHMRTSLSHTPERLPILMEMCVIDSGALGYITIIEGMMNHLLGITSPQDEPVPEPSAPTEKPVDLSAFNENSRFDDGYCMEFILQLMNDPNYDGDFRAEVFTNLLQQYGDSLVLAQIDKQVKVHIHTKKPALVITAAQRYGEFLLFKLENMQLQHNEFEKNQQPKAPKHAAPRKPLGIIAVVNGEGNRRIYTELGCDYDIDGGPKMNASANDFITAIQSLNADAIAILPNNPNMMLAADQAVTLSKAENIHILSSGTIAEGFCALSMDIPDLQDIPARIAGMKQWISTAETLHVTTAVKNYEQNDVSCVVGDYITTGRTGLISSAKDPIEAILSGLSRMEDIDDRETCFFFRGAHADEALEADIEEAIQQSYPMMECVFQSGDQAIYDWIIGII